MIRSLTLMLMFWCGLAMTSQARPFTVYWYGPTYHNNGHHSIVINPATPFQLRHPQYTYPGFTFPQYVPNPYGSYRDGYQDSYPSPRPRQPYNPYHHRCR